MNNDFQEWYEKNAKEELIDFYYEGTMCDMPLLTKIEQLMERAYKEGYRMGIFECTPDWG